MFRLIDIPRVQELSDDNDGDKITVIDRDSDLSDGNIEKDIHSGESEQEGDNNIIEYLVNY